MENFIIRVKEIIIFINLERIQYIRPFLDEEWTALD